jgi:hypothetical protein
MDRCFPIDLCSHGANMISAKTNIKMEPKRVERAIEKGAFKNWGHAAAGIRKTAANSLTRVAGPRASRPGSPPHTHKGVFLKRSIRFSVNKTGAVIGPRFSVVGTIGSTHEFGGSIKNARYPVRQFMAPALIANLPRIKKRWKGSIGG